MKSATRSRALVALVVLMGTMVATASHVAAISPPTLSVGDVSVLEGNTGTRTAVFTVTLSAPSTQTVSATYATVAGTATAGADYTSKHGTVKIVGGKVTKTIAITVLPDAATEGDEQFAVHLSTVTNAVGGVLDGTATIVDDDPASTPHVAVGDATVDEGNAQNRKASLVIALDAPATSAVTMQYHVTGGTAASGSDYAPVGTKKVTIKAGQRQKTITVTVIPDTTAEVDETIDISLTNVVGAAVFDGTGTLTLRNDDGPVDFDGDGYTTTDCAP
ncbi:MAG: hypothetical protein JWL83_3389, partial [Actinomycetia bacterium]|nr:hypothetical protein [Actinomycetes bacterium]